MGFDTEQRYILPTSANNVKWSGAQVDTLFQLRDRHRQDWRLRLQQIDDARKLIGGFRVKPVRSITFEDSVEPEINNFMRVDDKQRCEFYRWLFKEIRLIPGSEVRLFKPPQCK